jgi:hypothetical protein
MRRGQSNECHKYFTGTIVYPKTAHKLSPLSLEIQRGLITANHYETFVYYAPANCELALD